MYSSAEGLSLMFLLMTIRREDRECIIQTKQHCQWVLAIHQCFNNSVSFGKHGELPVLWFVHRNKFAFIHFLRLDYELIKAKITKSFFYEVLNSSMLEMIFYVTAIVTSSITLNCHKHLNACISFQSRIVGPLGLEGIFRTKIIMCSRHGELALPRVWRAPARL